MTYHQGMKRLGYKNSSYYKEHYDYWNCGGATWRFGTQGYRNAWKGYRRALKKFLKCNKENEYKLRSLTKMELNSIEIEDDDEYIDKVLTKIYNFEKPKIKWYEFD